MGDRGSDQRPGTGRFHLSVNSQCGDLTILWNNHVDVDQEPGMKDEKVMVKTRGWRLLVFGVGSDPSPDAFLWSLPSFPPANEMWVGFFPSIFRVPTFPVQLFPTSRN
jgi:hypothetical protein